MAWVLITFSDFYHVAFALLHITNHCQVIDLETYFKTNFLLSGIEAACLTNTSIFVSLTENHSCAALSATEPLC